MTATAVQTKSTSPARTDWLLEADGLCKSYKGRRVVDNVSLKIAPGEVVGLIGPNGAGKTTTFYMVVGLVRPDAGRIHFRGQDVAQMPMYQRARLGMGYLCQEASIFRRMTVEENVMSMLETLNISAAERRERLRHLLDGLGLSHLAKQKAITCSGGEKRRLEITRALVTNPSFIMLDEPFAAIDPIAVQDVQKMIRQLKDMGLGILITDHSVRETLAIIDRAYLIIEGQIKYEGDSENFYKNKEARDRYIGEDFVK
jgi:lipopolysaccharide export system ATP-binding protein